MGRVGSGATVLAALLLLACPPAAWSQEMPVSAPAQATLFGKILTFERNLKARAGNELRLGVLYQNEVPHSLKAQEDFLYAMCGERTQTVEGLPVRCLPIEWSGAAQLEAVLARESILALYVAPLQAVEIGEIVAISRARRVTTLTGVPEYVDAGIALGLGLRAERTLILVNLAAARAEGAAFNSQLLKLARVLLPGSVERQATFGAEHSP